MKTTRHTIFSWAIAATSALLICSCTGRKFEVNGAITNAQDSVLYLENMSLEDGPVVLDSVKLGENGEFTFREDAPEAPEFYRLRIAGQAINLAIDSTEVVTIKAQYPQMPAVYTVEGSEECKKIQQLSLLQMDLLSRAIAIDRNETLGVEAAIDSINRLLEAYKHNIKVNYIFKEPMKASSYFALFQTLGSRLIFDPKVSKEDNKVYAAVATSWDTYYPKAKRGENLHNIALEGMKNVRIMANNLATRGVDASRVNTSNIIEISLLDNKGQVRRLTDLQGKVVLLDFHVFGMSKSTERIMLLRDLYNRYHARGLEIYQVSIDPDEHFWKTQTAALPWVSVRDADGTNSQYLLRYNVQSLPTYFLIDRNCMLQKRDAQVQDINAEIEKLL